jgi:CubicO group peptidase (beta-lactamase class C family)
MKRSRLALTLLFSSLYLAIAAQQNAVAGLNSYFNALFRSRQFNGNVLVAEKGKIIYERSFGYADFSTKKPNTKNTSFPIASITKTFTSTAILQLQEKGKLDINDRFVKYFADFPYPSITIRQLLSHTSYLPSHEFYVFLDSLQKIKDTLFTNNDVIPALIAMKKPLLGMPKGDRSDFAYSNLNFYLMALLIEKLSGMPYGSYIKKYIFFPAGMEHSSLSEFYFGIDKNLCREQKYRFIFSEIPDRIDTMAENLSIFRTYNFKGHGDIVSTVEDLLRYDQALYDGTLLKESSLALAFHAITPGIPGDSGYGLGWYIGNDSTNGKEVHHHGGGIGIEAMLVRNIARHLTIILFDNTKNFAFNIAMNALDILNGKKPPLVKPSVAKLYGKTLVNEGIPAARILLERLRKDTLNYLLTEDGMNVLAYQLMWNNINEKAMEVFQTNLKLFPESWNSYDSYGEILVKMGRKEEAIKMYQRSIELNPKNEGGKKVLAELLKK